MSEIPEDIGLAATYALDAILGSDSQYGWHRIIAAAILAERERCQKIAKRAWRDADFYENDAARRTATLIRCRIETGATQ